VPIIGESRYTSIQVIYADTGKETLFAGAMSNRGVDFGILYLDDTNSALRLLAGDTGMLSGAASRGGFHYLSTRGNGIYSFASDDITTVAQLADTDGNVVNRLFMGMIQLAANGPIIAVERNGGLFYEAREAGLKLVTYSNGDPVITGRFATGALALWQEVNFDDNGIPVLNENGLPSLTNRRMLIAGIQGGLFNTTTSSYTHGYVEIDLDSNLRIDSGGWLVLSSARRDIGPNITVNGKTDRYTATIGKHPINHFFQSPDSIDIRMTFFAATQTAGLWSYRNRSTGGWQWNAED